MINTFAISLGAGLSSALLFAVVVTGSPLAAMLSYAAPLPILIAAIGWNQLCGLAAAVVAAALLTTLLRPATGLAYVIGFGLPAWWIGYLVLLGRPVAAPPLPGARPDAAATEWYPLGRLLVWIAATAALIAFVGALAIGGGHHADYRRLVAGLVEAFARYEAGSGTDAALPPVAGLQADRVVRIVVAVIPVIAAAIFSLLLVANAWCAARVVAISGRLARPWPYLPATRMPAAALGLFACGVAAMFGSGYVGVAGGALAGALALAFALQALALLHVATAGRTGRGPLLGGVYILVVFFGGTVLPLLSLVGMLDTAIPLRRRLPSSVGRPD